MDFSCNIGGLEMKNPVIAASGVFGYGEEYTEVGDIGWFGAVSVKGTTLRPRYGNAPPRVCETPSGLLNSIGLENPGAEVVIKEKLPWLAKFDVPIIVNISAESYEEFGEIAALFADSPNVSALEINVSCPNVSAGGLAFGTDSKSCHKVTEIVRRAWNGPLIVKLSPSVTSIVEIAKAAEDAGADSVSLINTLVGMAIDIGTRKPILGNVKGGLSGPAVKPVAVRCVWEASQAVSIPVIGMGGIADSNDALEFIMAGAQAIAIGTNLLIDPASPKRVLDGLKRYCDEHKLESLGSITGVSWKESL